MNSKFTKSKIAKVIAGFVGLTSGVLMLGGAAVTTVSAQTVDTATLLKQINDATALIAALQSQLNALQGGSPVATTGTGYTFTANLTMGSRGEDVRQLQIALNMDPETQVASTGPGSKGNETTYFGGLTKAAVIKFQNKYASEVLTPVGLSAGTGYFGPSSRTKMNGMTAVVVPPVVPPVVVTPGDETTPVVVTPTGTASISAGAQPANSLAVQGAARVPFTTFVVKAGATDVVLDSVVVERAGLMNKAVFSGVVLLDSDGIQLGTSKTLNSVYQATIGESVTIKAGTSKTFTVAGNMATNLSSYAGEAGGLNVIAVNANVPLTASLPIRGAVHTANATLSIGSITTAVSAFDPNTSQTKEIGSTKVRFAGIRVTAGSGEDLRLQSIRWNQTGSAGSGDIANLVTVVDGVKYPVTVSADGKYYTSIFGNGIVVIKGGNVDVHIEGDIVSGSNRTIIFDIDKTTDIYITGELYGYGIAAPAGTGTASASNSAFTAGTPWFDASTMTISAGSATSISKSSAVAAQNIAVNVPEQPLGSFETDIKGEPITVTSMTMTVASTTGSGTGLLTNVAIYNANGGIVAGPIDATYTSALVQTLSFTDTVTLPTGKQVYTIKGKVASTIGNGGTYIVTVTPTNWGSPVGDTTGDSITLSQTAFALNTMTVKAAALDISVSPNPVAQNVVAGAQDFIFAKYQFDATQSGEDIRFSSFPAKLTFATMAVTEVTACQLFDGATPLNTGSNVVTPSGATGADQTFTFDQSLTIPKGTVKTLDLKCDLSSGTSANDTLSWGIQASPSITVTGVTSSNSVTETVTASVGQTMTVAAGSLVASEDATSPSYTIVAAGSTGITNGVINFRASNEDITLQRVGLTLTNTASSSSSDLIQVSLWDGGTQVGTATFVGSNTNATSTLSIPVIVPKDQDKDIIVKIDLANVGTSQSGTQGALIAVDINTNSTNTQGVGSSGTTINASGSTSFSGTRMFKSVPTIAKLAVPSAVLTTGTGVDLYRFSVSASAGGNGIGLSEVTVNIATSTASSVSGTTTVTNMKVYAYSDSSFSSPVSGFTNGQVVATVAGLVSNGDNAAALSSILQIPAGTTYYFRVTGDTTLTSGTGTFSGSVTTRLSGDAAYPAMAAVMGTSATVSADANDDFVWSPNATTTSAAGHVDWTNGYFVNGLPSDGTDAQTISK